MSDARMTENDKETYKSLLDKLYTKLGTPAPPGMNNSNSLKLDLKTIYNVIPYLRGALFNIGTNERPIDTILSDDFGIDFDSIEPEYEALQDFIDSHIMVFYSHLSLLWVGKHRALAMQLPSIGGKRRKVTRKRRATRRKTRGRRRL